MNRFTSCAAFVAALREVADQARGRDAANGEAPGEAAPFVVGVIADLSREARPEAERGVVPAELLLVRGPGDVRGLLRTLRPRVRIADVARDGQPAAVELEIRTWSDFTPVGIARQLRAQGVVANDTPTAVQRVLGHAAWQALEATWRGLDLVARGCGGGARPVVVRVLDVALKALVRDVRRSVAPLQTRTFQRLGEAGDGADDGIGLLVLDEAITGSAASAELLVAFAEMATALHTPLLTAAAPDLLSYDETERFSQLAVGRLDGIARRMSLLERRRVDALRSRWEGRLVWLLLPRILLRSGGLPEAWQPYAHPIADGADDGAALWGNPAYPAAADVAALVRDTGGFTPTPDGRASGARQAFPGEGTPEVEIPRRMVDALLAERLSVVTGPVSFRLPSFYRPGKGEAVLDLHLHDALWVAQLVQTVRRRWRQSRTGADGAVVAVERRIAAMNVWLAGWTPPTGPGSPSAPGEGRRLSLSFDATQPGGVWAKLTVGGPAPDIPGGGQFTARFLLPDA